MDSGIGYFATVLVAVVGSGGFWATVQLWMNRRGRKAAAAKEQSDEEKARSDHATLLAEAQAVAQRTALESAHEAYETVKLQCDACQQRLSQAEQRLQRSEQRMILSEERLEQSEDRGRLMRAALKAIIRVMDDNDPTQIDAAIEAARELI